MVTTRIFAGVIPALLLAACAGSLGEGRATYDLGAATVVWKPSTLVVADVVVQGPAWLTKPDISYRMLYVGDMQRNVYADSRWAGAPTMLIERALNRQPSASPGGCRLRLEVDELIQLFDTPQKSRMLLDARASLVAPGTDAVLARKTFSVASPAPSPDARGAAAGALSAVQALGGELNGWLLETARSKPATAQRCNGG